MEPVKITDEEIAQYLPHLTRRQKEAVLNVIKTFAEQQQDWWDEMSEEQQQAIDKSLAEMKTGNLTRHEEVMKKYKNGL